MKKLLLIMLICLSSGTAFSQIVCRIFYDYDNAGNRIKRYYKCYDPNVPEQANPGSWVNAVVYPNPTTGPVTVSFDQLVDQATMTIADMSGRVLLNQSFERCYEMQADMTRFIAGTYVMTVTARRADYEEEYRESFTIVRMSEDE